MRDDQGEEITGNFIPQDDISIGNDSYRGWKHLTIMQEAGKLSVYIDFELIAHQNGNTHLYFNTIIHKTLLLYKLDVYDYSCFHI